MTYGSNITAADAFERVQLARTGFLVRATDDFLLKLKALLYSWIADIDQEMALRIDAHNRMTEEP